MNRRFDPAGVLAAALAGAATAVYVVGEAALSWPVVQAEVTAGTVRGALDPGAVRAAAVSGGLALSSIVVGPEGLGPGLVFVLWGVLVPLMLLFGLRRSRA